MPDNPSAKKPRVLVIEVPIHDGASMIEAGRAVQGCHELLEPLLPEGERPTFTLRYGRRTWPL